MIIKLLYKLLLSCITIIFRCQGRNSAGFRHGQLVLQSRGFQEDIFQATYAQSDVTGTHSAMGLGVYNSLAQGPRLSESGTGQKQTSQFMTHHFSVSQFVTLHSSLSKLLTLHSSQSSHKVGGAHWIISYFIICSQLFMISM